MLIKSRARHLRDRERDYKTIAWHDKMMEWHSVFCLWPRRLDDNTLVWLQTVEERCTFDYNDSRYYLASSSPVERRAYTRITKRECRLPRTPHQFFAENMGKTANLIKRLT